jgi:hypothetical protein
VARAHFRGE